MPFKALKKIGRKLFGSGKTGRLSAEQAEKLKGADLSKMMMAGPLRVVKGNQATATAEEKPTRRGGFAGRIGEAVKKAQASGKLAKTAPTKKSPFGAIGSAVGKAMAGKMKEDDEDKKKGLGAGIKAMKPAFKKGGSVSKKPMAAKKPMASKTGRAVNRKTSDVKGRAMKKGC